jgi:hypothetical protein
MRPLPGTAVLLPPLFLTSCGSTDEVIQNSPTTYSVSAEYGSTMGGWDRAKEATAKAMKFCEPGGQQVALRDEQRSGNSALGAPLKSTITFACVSDPTGTGAAAVAAPVPATLNAKRTAAIKKCTDGLKFDSNRYVACMSK